MTTLSVRSNIQKVRKKYKFADRRVQHAARRALNRTATQVNTQARRSLSKEIGLPQKTIKPYLSIKRANYTSLSAEIRARPRTFNIASFAGVRQTKRGVKSKAWGKSKTYSGAFLINAGKTAMVRVGPRRLPIRPVYGPRLHGEFARSVVNAAMVKTTQERFPRNFHHELKRELGKIGIRLDG